jgi:hypothetical protein
VTVMTAPLGSLAVWPRRSLLRGQGSPRQPSPPSGGRGPHNRPLSSEARGARSLPSSPAVSQSADDSTSAPESSGAVDTAMSSALRRGSEIQTAGYCAGIWPEVRVLAPLRERRGRPAQTGPGWAGRCPVGSRRSAAAGGQGQDGEANDGQLHGESLFTNSCGHGPRRDDRPVHGAYRQRPGSSHAQTS